MIDSQRALGPELVIIISHPAAASGIIVLLKTSPKYRKMKYNKSKNAYENSWMELYLSNDPGFTESLLLSSFCIDFNFAPVCSVFGS